MSLHLDNALQILGPSAGGIRGHVATKLGAIARPRTVALVPDLPHFEDAVSCSSPANPCSASSGMR